MATKDKQSNKGEQRTLEDIHVGEKFETGSAILDRQSVRRFAESYDPQPLHLDEAAARETLLGTMVASAWQVLSVSMRLITEAAPFGSTPMIGLGFDKIRLRRPVLPETEIRCRGEVREVRRSSSKFDRGYVQMYMEILNAANGELLISYYWSIVVPVRTPVK